MLGLLEGSLDHTNILASLIEINVTLFKDSTCGTQEANLLMVYDDLSQYS